MRTQTDSSKSHATALQPFFSTKPDRAPSFFTATPFTGQVSALQPKITMGSPGDHFEREADAIADRVVQRLGPANITGRTSPVVQTKCAACHEEDHSLPHLKAIKDAAAKKK